jgi:acetate kinase
MDRIAVINAGSSSIKFALFEVGLGPNLVFRGQIEGIGTSPRMTVESSEGVSLREASWKSGEIDHGSATDVILETVVDLLDGKAVTGVGHRVVHGGTRFTSPVAVSEGVLQELKALCPLAPLHQPHNIAAIEAILAAAPRLPQVACFDTAFHQTQPRVAQSFALPRQLTSSGIRRYGFHGLSYEFILGSLREIAPALASKRLIIAHLGNGASLCAVHHGHSVASTMGFTAVDGLMMGTRCGSIDPGVLIYLMDEHGMDARALEMLVYKKSGLLGVSGISSDMRALRASPEPEAREAIDLFVYRIVREIGSLAAALGGVEGLVFTGGIGQKDAKTRAEVVAGCAWLGAAIDEIANSDSQTRIDDASSRLPIWVLPTNEEAVIASHSAKLLASVEVSGRKARAEPAPERVRS